MTILQALLLGIIQGLTEFLPVSSSGHLVLAQNLLGVDKALLDEAIVFDLTLHLGTVVAVFYCYWDDIKKILHDIFCRNHAVESKGGVINQNLPLMFLVSIIGTAIIALPFEKFIKDAFENAAYAAIGLVITSIILFTSIFAKGDLQISRMSGLKAFLIGLAQGVAAMPGISRSGCTIVSGMALGFVPKEAARYSFLLSIPTIILASMVQAMDAVKEGSLNVPAIYYVIGFIASMIFGIVSIKALIKFLESTPIAWFGAYCFPIGIITYFLVR